METQTIIFMGPQGSGKGTQVDLVKQALEANNASVLHLQTGQPFREMVSKDTYTAKQIVATINSGALVPDWITNAIVAKELEEKLTEDTTLIFDGFPRNLEQANVLEDMLAFYNRNEIAVVFLDTAEAVVRERMKGRGRDDDTDEAIDKRLAAYREQTEPVVDYYKQRVGTDMIIVNGADTIETVAAEIKAQLAL